MLTPFASSLSTHASSPSYLLQNSHEKSIELQPMVGQRSVDPAVALYDLIDSKGVLNFLLGSDQYQPLSYYFKKPFVASSETVKNIYDLAKKYFNVESSDTSVRTSLEVEKTAKSNTIPNVLLDHNVSMASNYSQIISNDNNEMENGVLTCNSWQSVPFDCTIPGFEKYSRVITWQVSVIRYLPLNSITRIDSSICQTVVSIMESTLWDNRSFFILNPPNLPKAPPDFMQKAINVYYDGYLETANYTIYVNFFSNAPLNVIFPGDPIVYANNTLAAMLNTFLWLQPHLANDQYSYLPDLLAFPIKHLYKKRDGGILAAIILCPILGGALALVAIRKVERILEKREDNVKNRLESIYGHRWTEITKNSLTYLAAKKVRNSPIALNQLLTLANQDLIRKVMCIFPTDYSTISKIIFLLRTYKTNYLISRNSAQPTISNNSIEIVIDNEVDERTPLISNQND